MPTRLRPSPFSRLMGKIWLDPRGGKEWRVHFTWMRGGVAQAVSRDHRPGGVPEPSDPVAIFFHPTDPSMTRERRSADRLGDEDLDAMTDQELMDLLDKVTP